MSRSSPQIRRLAIAAKAVLAAALVLMPAVWAFDPFHQVRQIILVEQLIVAELGIAMALVLWGETGRETPARIPISDRILGLTALAACLWLAVDFNALGFLAVRVGPGVVALCLALLALALECCRRVAGLPMTLLIAAFVAYGLGGQFLSGPLATPPIRLENYAYYLVIGGDALVGNALEILATVVVVFVLFGKTFEFAGGAAFVRDLTLHLAGASRGGPVKIAVLASGLLGSIIGSTTSNILTSGNFSIPMMRRIGLPAHRAAAIEAVASTGGQLTPPVMGAAAFLMTDIAGLRYSSVMIAAALPSALYYFSLFVQADRMAARYGLGRVEAVEDAVPPHRFLLTGLAFAIPVAVMVACLARYEFAPEWAGMMGVVAVALIAFLRRRSWSTLAFGLCSTVVEAGRSSAGLVILGAAVGIMLGVINWTGLGVSFAVAISNMGAHSLFLALLIAACASYLLGMGLATTAVYVLVGTLVAPSLVNLGVSLAAAHLFVFYTAMLSMITPPVAIACLVASGLAGASFMKTSVAAIEFGWIKFALPFLFVYSPELLFDGTPLGIVSVTMATLAGVVFFSNAITGYERDRIGAYARLSYLAGAVVLLVPLFPTPYRLAFGIVAVLWLFRARLLWPRRSASIRS